MSLLSAPQWMCQLTHGRSIRKKRDKGRVCAVTKPVSGPAGKLLRMGRLHVFSGEQCRSSASTYEHMSSLLQAEGLSLSTQRCRCRDAYSLTYEAEAGNTGRTGAHQTPRRGQSSMWRLVVFVHLLEFSKWGKINHAGVMPCHETTG